MRSKEVWIRNGAGNEIKHILCCYDDENVAIIYTPDSKDTYMGVNESMVEKKLNNEREFLENCNIIFWNNNNTLSSERGKPFQKFIIDEDKKEIILAPAEDRDRFCSEKEIVEKYHVPAYPRLIA